MRKNVAVIFGGISCENEISVITGTMAANLIDPEKYAVYPVYIAQNGEMYTGEQLRDTGFCASTASPTPRPIWRLPLCSWIRG